VCHLPGTSSIACTATEFNGNGLYDMHFNAVTFEVLLVNLL
jgi:hypothetical protein